MNIHDMNEAIRIAKSDADLDHLSISAFDGYAMKQFQPIECTIEQVAKLIRYQARYFNGDWDHRAIDEVVMFRYKFKKPTELKFEKALDLLARAYKDVYNDDLADEINKFVRMYDKNKIKAKWLAE
jgi:hypothetical protein